MTSIRKTMKLIKTSLNAKTITFHLTRRDGKRFRFTPTMRRKVRMYNAQLFKSFCKNYKIKHRINIKRKENHGNN
jgi:hypothetical protein